MAVISGMWCIVLTKTKKTINPKDRVYHLFMKKNGVMQDVALCQYKLDEDVRVTPSPMDKEFDKCTSCVALT